VYFLRIKTTLSLSRASQEEMRSNAERETDATVSAPSSRMGSALVDNAEPMSFTATPKTALDSGV
jgi:hypothetical protein